MVVGSGLLGNVGPCVYEGDACTRDNSPPGIRDRATDFALVVGLPEDYALEATKNQGKRADPDRANTLNR